MSTLELAFAFFVIVLSKIILGIIVCWMLMPQDAECPACDAPLLPLAAPRGRRRLFRLLRLQRRWCMECGTALIGRRRSVEARVPVQAPVVTTRWSQ